MYVHASIRAVEVSLHRRETSDWPTHDHLTLRNSKWRQYIVCLFQWKEDYLRLNMSCKCNIRIFWNSLDFSLSFFTYSYGIRSQRCSRFGRFTRFNFGLVDHSSRSRRTTTFLKKTGSQEGTAFVHSSVHRRSKTLWVL